MDIKQIRVRIMSEAYDLADRGDHEGYNAIKVMCSDVLKLIGKQWVGLTDEDIHDAFNFTEMVKQLSWDREPEQWCKNFAAYIEAKIKDKNHG